ncbi:odorant receptor 4-like [Harpegnathos saltator]|uniref:odorant receptor 4-like n=1 Tax=Harpegnathos saltator TaxID=610380 RepID=UPI000DBEE084|nr:odorant receptor 4-like [Harpegnathos saltator]
MYISVRKFTFLTNFSVQIYGSVLVYSIYLYMPDILDIVSPMNESRSRKQYFKLEYLVPEEQHVFFYRMHIIFVMVFIATIFFANIVQFVTLAQHVCGMCELLGYRAERLFCVVESTTGRDLGRSKKLIYRNTAIFIQLHHNTIQFVGTIERFYTIPFLLDFLGVVITLSLTLSQVVSNDVEQLVRSMCLTNMQISYITLSNYMGQQIIDKSSNIYDKVYNSEWYNAIVSQQKPLLLIMRQRFLPLVITSCKFYVMSLANLGKIFQMTASYCMFIRQV